MESKRLQIGEYSAEVLQSTGSTTFWYYTVEHDKSPGIVSIEAFATREEAMAAALETLRRLTGAAVAGGQAS